MPRKKVTVIGMKEKLREEGTHAVNEDGLYMEDMLMELRLGRALRDDETVFHRNGNTLDNRDANLYVVESDCLQ